MVLRMGTKGSLNSAWLRWRLSTGFTDSLRESSIADSKVRSTLVMSWFVKGLEYSAKSPGNTVFKEQVFFR